MLEELSRIGEHSITQLLSGMLRSYWKCNSLDPGDDAACAGLESPLDRIIVKTDGGSIGSNLAPWMSLYDLGWMMVVGSISDVVAKAALPVTVQVSVGVPPSMRGDMLLALIRGVRDAALAHGAWLSGGDTNSSPHGDGWVDVFVLGLATPGGRLLARRPGIGDIVYTTTGRYGLMGALLHSLETGVWTRLYNDYRSVYIEASRQHARLGFAYLATALGDCITGSIDVSDGLAYTLHQLAVASNSALVVEKPPRHHYFAEVYSAETGVRVEDLVFYGGQEYEIVFTVKPECRGVVENKAARYNLEVQELGYLAKAPKPRLVFRDTELEPRGWDNFKGFSH